MQNTPAFDSHKTRLRDIGNALRSLVLATPFVAINTILTRIHYADYLNKMSSEGYSSESLTQRVNTLLALALECKTIQDFLSRMEYLSGYENKTKKNTTLTLSTIHGSKGLEFDRVIIIDAFEGILPSDIALDNLKHGDRKAFEEEVRLFYVAATRAKKQLEILTARTRFSKPVRVSRFVNELLDGVNEKPAPKTGLSEIGKLGGLAVSLPKLSTKSEKNDELPLASPKPKSFSPLDFVQGKPVTHKVFGDGYIDDLSVGVISVLFTSGEPKRFLFPESVEQGLLVSRK
jgi:DNA helicase-2/ATP-dependent DNA helicase PcrA